MDWSKIDKIVYINLATRTDRKRNFSMISTSSMHQQIKLFALRQLNMIYPILAVLFLIVTCLKCVSRMVGSEY